MDGLILAIGLFLCSETPMHVYWIMDNKFQHAEYDSLMYTEQGQEIMKSLVENKALFLEIRLDDVLEGSCA